MTGCDDVLALNYFVAVGNMYFFIEEHRHKQQRNAKGAQAAMLIRKGVHTALLK